MHPYLMPRKLPDHDTHTGRVLLALDGSHLTRDVLALALDRCSDLAKRIDVLLVKPTREAITLMRDFLFQLNQRDIPCRLTMIGGPLAKEVARYMKRYPDINTVVTHNQANWPVDLEPVMEKLLLAGYRFVFLSNASRHQ